MGETLLDPTTAAPISWLSPESYTTPGGGAVVDVWRICIARNHPSAHIARDAILRRYLDLPAYADVRIERQPGGKPVLSDRTDLEFNLSHSRDYALLAVSFEAPVGIDIECIRAIRDPLKIAARVWPKSEQAWLQSQPSERQLDGFFWGWTRFEARQKAMGRGILATPVDPKELQWKGFVPLEGYVAALAIASQGSPTLRFFDSDGP